MKPRALLFTLLLWSGLFLFFPGVETGNAAEFPSRPVELIVSGSAGGGTDIGMRIIGPELSRALGVPVVFTNKGGAGGAMSAEYASRAKPDGYTVLAASGNVFTVILIMNPKLPYKLDDFIPLAKYASSPTMFAVRKDSPFKTFEELISYAKKNPGKLTCATAGAGTTAHFALELVKIHSGADIAHMPARSGGEVVTAFLGKQVDFVEHSFGPMKGLLQSGDARGLASVSRSKLPGYPDIPTLEELGYPPPILYWLGFYVPKGTPEPIVNRLSSAFEKAIKSPEVKKNLEKTGYLLDYQDGPTIARYIPQEYKLTEEISRRAKLIK